MSGAFCVTSCARHVEVAALRERDEIFATRQDGNETMWRRKDAGCSRGQAQRGQRMPACRRDALIIAFALAGASCNAPAQDLEGADAKTAKDEATAAAARVETASSPKAFEAIAV